MRDAMGAYMKRILFSCAIAPLAIAGLTAQEPAPNTLTPAEKAAGWRLLFDGKTTAGWRGYKSAEMPAGWQVTPDGALARASKASDIISVDQFGSFEFSFDWKIEAGGNSGVIYRVTEDLAAPWHSGPEYQILDNGGHADGKKPETSAASDYALHPPVKDVTRPIGSWNTGRIVVRGTHVEHWLNDVKVLEYEIGSPDWAERVKNSKFSKYPKFGLAERGHIVLQDHGDPVAFRNLKIRTL